VHQGSDSGGQERRERRDLCRLSGFRTGPAVFFAGATFQGGAKLASDNSRQPRVRVNRQIRISPVRVIGSDGTQLGVMPVDEALSAAQERGLDLVEVSPLARPPVVKIMDYGKFKFEQAKASRAARKKQHVIHLKEVKYRPGISDHDFEFKTRHAREFLQDGNKVKVTMMYRGRQMAHVEIGRGVLDRVAAELKDVGKIEQEPRLEGRNMTMVIGPK
jgi:translation initiation factor IF-3